MQRRRKNALRRNHPDVPKNSVKKTVGFIVRIHTGRHASDEIKLELRKMNLNHKYDGVFTILDENRIRKFENILIVTSIQRSVVLTFSVTSIDTEHLKAFDSYVAYGYVTNKSVVELVHRRAFANISGVKKPLTDNMTVETMLGDKGILCLNDLSHEVFSVGPNFDAATKMLCTFKLSSPTGNYEKTILKINDSVEETGGFLGDEMDTFLNKIL